MGVNPAILCIEDDPDARQLLNFLLEEKGFFVKCCVNGNEGVEQAGKGAFQAILLDYWLPDINGVEVCRKIRSFDSTTPIIFYSAAAFPKDKQAAIDAGAQDYLVKPNDFEKIPEAIRRLTVLRKTNP